MKIKECNKCNDEFPLDEFPFKNKKKGTKYPWCYECHKKYRREYYSKNKDKVISKDYTTMNRRRTEKRQIVWDYYKNNPCVDCGEDNPIVLEFDHRDGVEKTNIISKMVNGNWGDSKIMGEIKKCDVRCSNCHKIRTSIKQNWYKDIIK